MTPQPEQKARRQRWIYSDSFQEYSRDEPLKDFEKYGWKDESHYIEVLPPTPLETRVAMAEAWADKHGLKGHVWKLMKGSYLQALKDRDEGRV